MFGSNEIVGQKQFRNAPVSSLMVTSIFFTLQGEGPFSGMPAVFVRLAKCNLACEFCDTYFDKGEYLTFDEIEQRARTAISEFHDKWDLAGNGEWLDDQTVLVISGGEPMLQQNLTGFLLDQAPKWDNIQIESNGLVERTLPLGTTLVVSPKCTDPMLPQSGSIKRGHFLKPPPAVLLRADAMKFVVDANPLNAYHMPPPWAHQWMNEMRRPLFISPMNIYQEGKPMQIIKGREDGATLLEQRAVNERVSFWTPGLLDRNRNQENHEHAAELCMRFGYRLSLQTHLYSSLP